ncbi:MAG: alcohol dehydrogenase catalytic domain-containing protein [Oligoflexales bacterium]
MKALVYTNPFELKYMDCPEPVIARDEVNIQVQAVGICGSDLHAYQGHDERRNPPLILGHEVVGIAQNGRFEGQSVIINPLITCMRCEYCLGSKSNLCAQRELIGMNQPGAFAEYVSVKERNCIPMEHDFNPIDAVLTEPVATALHGINLMIHSYYRPIQEAEVLVMGGGSVGLAAALLLKSFGCQKVHLAETNKKRFAMIKNTCDLDLIDPINTQIPAASFHCIIDAVGIEQTRKLSCQLVKVGGVILHIGLGSAKEGVDVRKLTLGEISFIGSYTYDQLDLIAAAKALETGKLGSLKWVDVRGLEQGSKAFSDLVSGRTEYSKIVLQPKLIH